MQRKNQKLIEESPSTAVDERAARKADDAATMRAAQGGQATRAWAPWNTCSTREGEFYFMEMNTRLQVEHPVTEMVTGIDLVKWQIRVAAGMELPFSPRRHPFCAATPSSAASTRKTRRKVSAPACGRVTLLHVPGRAVGAL